MAFRIVMEEGDFVEVALDGRLDSAGAGALETRFFAAMGPGRKAMSVDLSAVPFVASMGIRILVTAAKTLARRGGSLVLFALQPQVREALEATGIDQTIPFAADAAEARRVARGD